MPPSQLPPSQTMSSLSGHSHSQPQRFALTWNDYRSSLVSAFDSLRGEGEFVDVTLAAAAADEGAEGGGGVGRRRFGAHKVLLSACSPYFRSVQIHQRGRIIFFSPFW